jgi:4-hydroxy-3-polyprenylbenzoate decarboxylase
MSTFVVAITGASGAIYGVRLIRALMAHGHRVELIVSTTGRAIVAAETGIELGTTPDSARTALLQHLNDNSAGPTPSDGANLTVHGLRNLHATIASGSVATHGMVLCPCSMKSLAAISGGFADDLIGRAADVHIKEGRPLILVPRETPLSPIHLENMLKLSRLQGVRVIPAMPAFYNGPVSIMDLVDFVVARILDNLRLEIDWGPRWQGADGGDR